MRIFKGRINSVLTILAVMALSIAILFSGTACKGNIKLPTIALRGPNLPSQPGLHIDAGYGYKSDKEVNWVTAPPASTEMFLSGGVWGSDDPLVFFNEDNIHEPTPVMLTGDTIRIATRSMGWSYQEAEQTYLCPLSYQAAESGGKAQYVCRRTDMIRGVTVNQSKPEQSYTYVEICNIPEASSGYYVLFIERPFLEGYKMIALQRQ